MRKSKTPLPPAPFVYLRDVLPELAKFLSTDLRKIGERLLAAQVSDLRIYGRCCNNFGCGRFYCVPQEERRELHRRGLTRNVGLELIVAKDKIVEVNTHLPEVDAVLQRVFPNSENDIQEAILLKVEPESLRRSGMGTISGRVYLQTNAGGFPEVGWDDIVVAVLCSWLNAVNFVSAGSGAQVVHFMEGPYRVELKHAQGEMISLLLVEDRGNGDCQEFFASVRILRRNAYEAADLILTKCRQLAWLDSDIDQLTRLRNQTSL